MASKPRMLYFRFFMRVGTLLLLLSCALMSMCFMVGDMNSKSIFPMQILEPEGDVNHLEIADQQPNPFPMTPEIIPKVEMNVRRRGVLIFGDDRSGTTFLTRMFSEDPQNFVVYEPLWITRRWEVTHGLVYGSWEKNVREVTSALLSCRFPASVAASRFLAYTNTNWAAGLFHNPFIAPPFCNHADKAKVCPFVSPEFAEEMCATKFKHSVVKVALIRVPDRKLSNLIPQILSENPDTDIKVLHVVRDPRGTVNSRINLHWIPDYTAKAFPRFVRGTCEGITPNVKFGQSLEGWQKDRYRLVRYKDLAGAPLKTAQELYDFAGFKMPESLKEWITQSTNPSKEKLAEESKKTFSTIRNSTANIEKWRQQSSIERNRIIQRECSELFDLLELDRL